MGLADSDGRAGGDRYLALVRRFPLRPIRTESELDGAVVMIDDLLDRGTLTDEERDYLLVLSDLVETYERKAYPVPKVSDANMLRFLIENKGVTQIDVSTATGIAESTLSEILSGKRALNRRHIGKLAGYFHVGPGVFGFAK